MLKGFLNREIEAETEKGNGKQTFLPTSLRYNLRQRTDKDKPTIIYAVVYYEGQKHVINTNVKVKPSQWNIKKQIAVVSNELTELDNRNNKIANDRLAFVKNKYNETLNEVSNDLDRLNEFFYIFGEKLNVKQAKTIKEIDFSTDLERLNVADTSVTESTKKLRLSALQIFIDYLKENNIENKASSITYKLWENYKQYLLDLKTSNGKHYAFQTLVEYTTKLKTLFRLYNDSRQQIIISVDALKPLKKHNTLNEEQKQSKHLILTENEIESLYVKKLTDYKQQTAKNLYLFQCLVGCRVSDLKKIVLGDYTLKEFDGITYINYQSVKTNADTHTPLFTQTSKDLYDWVNTLKKFPFNDTSDYDKQLKKAFKSLNYTELTPVTDDRNGIETTYKHQYEIVSSHDARHTFVTNMYYKGVPAEKLKFMTGHSNTKMIDEVYKKLDMQKELQQITQTIKRA